MFLMAEVLYWLPCFLWVLIKGFSTIKVKPISFLITDKITLLLFRTHSNHRVAPLPKTLYLSIVNGGDCVLAQELVHLDDTLAGVIRPEHAALEYGQVVGWGHLFRAPHNVDPVLAVVVDSFNVIQEYVGPEDTACLHVDRDTAGLVHGIVHKSFNLWPIHVRAQDTVVVSNEHQTYAGIQSNVSRTG